MNPKTQKEISSENNSYIIYNEDEFKKENILNFLLSNGISKNNPICEIYDKQKKLVKIKNRIGKIEMINMI